VLAEPHAAGTCGSGGDKKQGAEYGVQCAVSDPRLKALIDAWPRLSQAVEQKMAELAESQVGGDVI
jgi:hypothetical protein